MTEKGATQIKVGIAVTLGLILFAVTVVMLGGDSSIFSSTYQLKVAFDKVDGLAPGSLVRLSGFQVGNVSDIEFSEQEAKLVVNLSILKKHQSRITKNSLASLKTQGALGDKYVSIDQGQPNEEFLEDGDFIPLDASGDLFQTISQRGTELTKLFDILNELQVFAKALNQDGRSDKLMLNLVQASQETSSAMAQLNLALQEIRGEDEKNLKKVGKALASIAEKIDNGSGTLGGLINDPTIHDKLKNVLGGSQRSEYMKSLIQKTIKEGEQ